MNKIEIFKKAFVKIADISSERNLLKQRIIQSLKEHEGYGTILYKDKKDSPSANPNGYVTSPGGVLMTPKVQNYVRNLGFKDKFSNGVEFTKYRDAVFNREIDSRLKELNDLYGTSLWGKLDDDTKADLFNLHWNANALTGWKNTAKAMREGNLNDVLTHLKDSKVYRSGNSRWVSTIERIARRNKLMNHYNPNEGKTYYVKSGDTLGAIAKANGLSLNELLELNPNFKKNPNALSVGQKVNLSGVGSFTNNKSNISQKRESDVRNNTYMVRKGDNFWKIEKSKNLPYGTLQKLNPGLDPKKIHPGQIIKTASIARYFISQNSNKDNSRWSGVFKGNFAFEIH